MASARVSDSSGGDPVNSRKVAMAMIATAIGITVALVSIGNGIIHG